VSHAALSTLLLRMEAWLADPLWAPEPEVLAQWVAAFREARRTPEGAAAWPALAPRAEALATRLEAPLRAAEQRRDALRTRLDAWTRGARALRTYAPRD
jgi:hypothetical protein